ncbi:universal stress protein [Halobacteria archaeon HArc-gm2]|nr:universal stress protein [Halobacteria archaeon HArc-gm2]
MYERILFPTDGSAGTAHVALQAIDLAQQYGATIHVLHVVDEDLRGLVEGLSGEDALETEGQRALERIEQMAEAHGVDVTTAIEEGDPAESIVAYADDIHADLIVAGTHGRTGIKRRVIGSVAERIVRNATCPVMTVRLGETDVTVDSKDEARELATAAIERDGIDATVTGVERQVSVWVVDAESDASSYVVYVDPVTQRTSVIDRD